MDLLNPPPETAPNPWSRRFVIAVVLLLILSAIFYYQFRYYRETRAVENFMDALVAGDYPKAYQLWQPSSTYSYRNFMRDWGETSTLGRIRSYEIGEIRDGNAYLVQFRDEFTGKQRTVEFSGKSTGIVVNLYINGRKIPERLWVEKSNLSLSFPPF